MTALRDVIQAAYLSHPPGEPWEDAAERVAWDWFATHHGARLEEEAATRGDLLEQLRLHGRHGVRVGSSYQLRANALCAEAAVEIERLRAANDHLMDEIERLTIENSER